MEILQDIIELSVAARIIKERIGQDVQICLECTDPTGFLEVDGGVWRDLNEDILESNLIVALPNTDARGIGLEGIPIRIAQDEFEYFNVKCVVAEEL